MNFLNFEYVLSIRKIGTIRGAAEELFISPQALSEHLGKLERELGTPLFYRTKPMTLTESGERFVAFAECCLDARKQFEAELSSIRQKNDRHISIGVPTGMPPPMLLSFLSFFRSTHPEYSINTVELPTRTGAFNEIPNHIDAVIDEFRTENSKLLYTPILQSNHFVVAIHQGLLKKSIGADRAEEIKARIRKNLPISLSEFQTCPFVLKRAGSITRSNEDRLFSAVSFQPRGEMETGDMELTVRMVLGGEAAVFFPEPVARANLFLSMLPEAKEILLCPIRAEHELWQLSVGYGRYRHIPERVNILVEAAKAYYQSTLGT